MGAGFASGKVPKQADLLPSSHAAADLRILRDLGGLQISFSLMIDSAISFVLL
jgi:hypothetical protein